MRDYVAWVSAPDKAGGFASVAFGSLAEVREKAKDVLRSDAWARRYGKRGVIRITRGKRQYFAEQFIFDESA